jgi:transposase InsO family protein
MEKLLRRRYTLEYKREAVRLVVSGQKVSTAAKSLGIVEQTLPNLVKADKQGELRNRKDNCWDNACSEALFGSLKVERLHGEQFKTHREGKDATLDWLLWYKRSKLHSTLGYRSPAEFEDQANAQLHALAA